MALIDGMLRELEEEAVTTRRVLERVPDNRLGWRPHRPEPPSTCRWRWRSADLES